MKQHRIAPYATAVTLVGKDSTIDVCALYRAKSPAPLVTRFLHFLAGRPKPLIT